MKNLMLWTALVASGCSNPAVDARIEALGDENPLVAPSEFHRPGQPCVLCHSAYEGAEPEISVGGTIFATKRDPRTPVAGARVKIWDSSGAYRLVITNCIGNFFIKKEDWDPGFPLHAEVEYDVPGAPDPATGKPVVQVAAMGTRIGRDGSCAGCHINDGDDTSESQGSPGRVFCTTEPLKFPAPVACAGKL